MTVISECVHDLQSVNKNNTEGWLKPAVGQSSAASDTEHLGVSTISIEEMLQHVKPEERIVRCILKKRDNGTFYYDSQATKIEAATWLKPAGEYNSAVTDTSIATSSTISVGEMLQHVKPEEWIVRCILKKRDNGTFYYDLQSVNKNDTEGWLKPAVGQSSAASDTEHLGVSTISVEEMLQHVKPEDPPHDGNGTFVRIGSVCVLAQPMVK